MPKFELSPAQNAAIEHRGSDLQIIACAGSGKTESVSRRIAGLIADGVEPAAIVAFTFTERAAGELKNRVVARVEDVMGREFIDRLGPMFVGTIHGYCFRLLQDHVPRYGNYDVLDEHRHAGLLSREHRRLGLSRLGGKHWAPIRDWSRTVDVIGNELIPVEALAGTPVGDVYADYREMLDRYHFLTFSLLIAETVKALQDPKVYERVHAPLRHLFVDEYQDINPAQERLIELLAADPVELTVVGDDDQAIYQWRGSDVGNMTSFADRRPQASQVTLDANRRCRPAIVAAANEFAKTISGRLEKTMLSVRPSGPNEIVPWSAPTEAEEAEKIADTIKRLHEQGYQYRDIAVLYRSVRTSAPPLIDALRARGIPLSCAGRTGLFLQSEIAILGEIFAWFVDGQWRDDQYGPFRDADLDHIVSGLEQTFNSGEPISDLRKYLEDWKDFQLRGARTVSLVGDFYQLLWFLRAHEIDVNTPEGSTRFGALGRFSKVLADFEHVNRRGRYVEEGGSRTFRGGNDRGVWYFRNLHNYLLHYAKDAYEDFDGEEGPTVDAVDILTIHQAKGLEWPIVFMPALVDGRFPSRRAGTEQDWLLPESVFSPAARARYAGGDSEERRLFYVGLTRARDSVYLSCFEKKKNKFKPSPYLKEIAKATLESPLSLPLPGAPASTDEEIVPLDVSFSDIALFEDCAYRYRLGSILGFQQELAPELGYGKAIHHVLRQVAENARSTGKMPSSEDLRTLVNEEFYLPFANMPAFDRMYQAANRLVGRYVDEYSDDLKRVWALERPFELHLPEGRLAGRADVILDEEGGQKGALAIVDYKVTTDPDRDPRYRQQLGVYAAAGRGEGLQVEAAYLHALSDGARDSIDISTKPVQEAVDLVRISMQGIRDRSFQPSPEEKKCSNCDYRKICSAGAPSSL